MPEPRQDARYGCEDEAREALVAASGAVVAALGAGVGALLAAAPGTSLGSRTGSALLSLRWPRSGATGFLVTSGPAASSGPDLESVVWTTLAERPPDHADAAGRQAEWRLHRHLYRERAHVGAIIRSRPVCATALACMPAIRRSGIPAFHADVSAAGGDSIRCAGDAPLGSSAWADQVLEALQDRTACLLAGRGLLVTGATLGAAAALTVEIEALAQIYCQVLQLQATAAGDEAPPRPSAKPGLAGEGRR